MAEKKIKYSLGSKIIILFFTGFGILSILTTLRSLRDESFIARVHSWILVGTRGYYGNMETLGQLSRYPLYTYELLGDTHYRRGDLDSAIDAYSEALKIKANTMIELKRNLLIAQMNPSGGTKTSATGTTETLIDETISRVEKDASNRGKYFGKNESYSNLSPIFEVRDKEIIDW